MRMFVMSKMIDYVKGKEHDSRKFGVVLILY